MGKRRDNFEGLWGELASSSQIWGFPEKLLSLGTVCHQPTKSSIKIRVCDGISRILHSLDGPWTIHVYIKGKVEASHAFFVSRCFWSRAGYFTIPARFTWIENHRFVDSIRRVLKEYGALSRRNPFHSSRITRLDQVRKNGIGGATNRGKS
jgi:hypothetical protein